MEARVWRITVLVFITLFGLISCNSTPYTPHPASIYADLSDWERIPVEFVPINKPLSQVYASENQIVVTGAMSTPTPCYRLRGTAFKKEMDIIFRVGFESRLLKDTACMQVIAHIPYRAIIKNVPTESYRLWVIHENFQTGRPMRPVLEQEIEMQ